MQLRKNPVNTMVCRGIVCKLREQFLRKNEPNLKRSLTKVLYYTRWSQS